MLLKVEYEAGVLDLPQLYDNLLVNNPVKGVWHLGFVKLDTIADGSSSPNLEYTPDVVLVLLQNLELLGEVSLETETVSLNDLVWDSVGDSGGRDIPLL